MDSMWQYLFGGLLILVGMSFLRHHLRAQRLLEASQRWRSTEGEIARSEIEKTRKRRGTHQAKVSYTYTVQEKTFTGRRITIGGEVSTSGAGRARAWLDKYPSGSRVTVWYDPADPATACLERTHEGSGLEVAGGVLGLALGGALLLGLIGS